MRRLWVQSPQKSKNFFFQLVRSSISFFGLKRRGKYLSQCLTCTPNYFRVNSFLPAFNWTIARVTYKAPRALQLVFTCQSQELVSPLPEMERAFLAFDIYQNRSFFWNIKAPFSRVKTNVCTDKSLDGSTLRLHGTGELDGFWTAKCASLGPAFFRSQTCTLGRSKIRPVPPVPCKRKVEPCKLLSLGRAKICSDSCKRGLEF